MVATSYGRAHADSVTVAARDPTDSMLVRRQQLCVFPQADRSDPGLSGGLRELNNAPMERR